MKNTNPLKSITKMPRPGHLLLPGCAVAAGLLSVKPVFAADAASTQATITTPVRGAVLTLVVGRTATMSLASESTYSVESGSEFAEVSSIGETLVVRAIKPGELQLRVESPGQAAKTTTFRLITAVTAYVERRARAQVAAPDTAAPGGTAAVGTPSATTGAAPAPTTAAPAVATPAVAPVPAESAVPPLPALAPVGTTPAAPAPVASVETPAATPAPAVVAPLSPVVPGAPTVAAPTTVPAAAATTTSPVTVSPVLPPPSSAAASKVTYRTIPQLPSSVNAKNAKSSVPVTQGLARLLAFPKNILAVFFSDPAVMDARAINARTIAVTGMVPGISTLAVFTQRYPGDVVGQANVYRVEVTPKAGASTTNGTDTRTPEEVEAQINAALGDPRIRVSSFRLPDNSLAARLTGSVRSEAEIQAAVATASFFVPRVISGLYADINVPTLEAVLAGGAYQGQSDADLQSNLRKLTGNDSIELVPLPTGLAVKAEVSSQSEADGLLRLLPTLNREIVPFIVIKGQDTSSSPMYGQSIPLLRGEDRQLTDRLQLVTGVRTVYVVRTATNGIAIYGNVRTRAEYLKVRRLGQTMAQMSMPVAQQGTTQGGANQQPTGTEDRLKSYDPAHGYFYPNGVQLFVQITDPAESALRQVTIQTDVVEIQRTSLKNLGVDYGSATLLTETNTNGLLTRTINTALNQGVMVGGNGFAGTGGFGNIDPFRARLNALYQQGDVRVLSSPNVTALEGSAAQILIGGERPIPKVVQGGTGGVGTDIEFRRYGIMLTLRPTVTDDNSILLQIRADVSQPDSTTAITVNGTTVPGETSRSVNTTLTVRPGDIMVLGGLITNEKRVTTSKVPVLSQLPILGSLFQSRRFDNNQSELAIFMSPRITTLPVTMAGFEAVMRVPGLPELPSAQDTNPLNGSNSGQGSGGSGGGGR